MKVLRRVESGQGAPGDLEQLEALCKGIFGNTFCALGRRRGYGAARRTEAFPRMNSSPISKSGGARFIEVRERRPRGGHGSHHDR